MKTFLINLKKNTERLKRSSDRLKELGVEFERVEAVYGKELSSKEKRNAVNRFRWWCAQGRKIRDGEIGCALSHYKIYKRMINEGMDFACILEDDNVYSDNFKEVVNNVTRVINPLEPQVILLSNRTKEKHTSKDFLIMPARRDSGTFSYVITKVAAKRILDANLPMHVPCDYWRRWVSRGLVFLFHAFPTVCEPENCAVFGSDIETPGMERVSDFSICKWLKHKAKRLIGVAIDNVMPI